MLDNSIVIKLVFPRCRDTRVFGIPSQAESLGTMELHGGLDFSVASLLDTLEDSLFGLLGLGSLCALGTSLGFLGLS